MVANANRVRMGVDLHSRPLASRERNATLLISVAVLLVAVALPVLVPPTHLASPTVTLLYVGMLAVVLRSSFQLTAGMVLPAELIFIPLLAVLPAPLVPLYVILAFSLATAVGVLAKRGSVTRIAKAPMWAAFSLGPAIVLSLAGTGSFLHSPALIAAVVAAQFIGNLLAAGAFELALKREGLREFIGEVWLAYAADLVLLPVGVFVALTVESAPWRLALMMPLLIVFVALTHERNMRVREALELSDAYHGTVLVLGDIIEHDDTYTGEHSREVVKLSLAVASKIGLTAEQSLRVEFGARLHDVGKVAVPNEIINKPGALDEREWAIIKTHTVEGQRMLDRAGGLMREVGVIVRSSHERWDGTGYPDGLARTAIPIESRVVSACDAYNAMITDRSYRRALSAEVAVGELRRHAGSQFDPAVVQTLVDVISVPTVAVGAPTEALEASRDDLPLAGVAAAPPATGIPASVRSAVTAASTQRRRCQRRSPA